MNGLFSASTPLPISTEELACRWISLLKKFNKTFNHNLDDSVMEEHVIQTPKLRNTRALYEAKSIAASISNELSLTASLGWRVTENGLEPITDGRRKARRNFTNEQIQWITNRFESFAKESGGCMPLGRLWRELTSCFEDNRPESTFSRHIRMDPEVSIARSRYENTPPSPINRRSEHGLLEGDGGSSGNV